MTLPMHQDAAAAAAAVLRRTRMILLLLLLMFSLSSFPSVTAECPEKCLCIEEIFFCHKKGLDRIPDRIPPAIKVLDLSYNEIMDIESLAHLTELETLNLSNNNISELKHGAFANLSKLQSLMLSNNNISELKHGGFANLSELQILYLDNNKIENIETGAFNNLTSLKVLHLDYNNIHKLDLEMFKGLRKLDKLFLDHNMIRHIPPGTIDSLTSLSLLWLDHNPLTCDCNILLFVNVLKKSYPQRDVLWDNDPSCHFPVEMKEKSLKEITKNDFNCTSPDVIVVPENKTVSVGEQLQLSCKVVGDPEPYITWAKDDIDLELGKRVQVFQNNTLIISKVEKTDGGKYKCVASNYLGRKSFEAMVNVNGLAKNGSKTMFRIIRLIIGFSCLFIILANYLIYNGISNIVKNVLLLLFL
ncbi:peroxidasin homolog isoform X12 [Acyrthosiphon pisum]|uniref:Ig-like domain-containing protein n=1 Tax=Acyrthosiphon pisum TaxID=7029 RepID=A0A8R2JSF7_ACYPI|nr:peroxidasin homolog isoform X12 [Acyrthosiphon pisum]